MPPRARTLRDNGTEAAASPADLAEHQALVQALRAVARVTAQVAANHARGKWSDFGNLLTSQYGVSHTDAALFLDILAGRKP